MGRTTLSDPNYLDEARVGRALDRSVSEPSRFAMHYRHGLPQEDCSMAGRREAAGCRVSEDTGRRAAGEVVIGGRVLVGSPAHAQGVDVV